VNGLEPRGRMFSCASNPARGLCSIGAALKQLVKVEEVKELDPEGICALVLGGPPISIR
jgi:hypothetical protein